MPKITQPPPSICCSVDAIAYSTRIALNAGVSLAAVNSAFVLPTVRQGVINLEMDSTQTVHIHARNEHFLCELGSKSRPHSSHLVISPDALGLPALQTEPLILLLPSNIEIKLPYHPLHSLETPLTPTQQQTLLTALIPSLPRSFFAINPPPQLSLDVQFSFSNAPALHLFARLRTTSGQLTASRHLLALPVNIDAPTAPPAIYANTLDWQPLLTSLLHYHSILCLLETCPHALFTNVFNQPPQIRPSTLDILLHYWSLLRITFDLPFNQTNAPLSTLRLKDLFPLPATLTPVELLQWNPINAHMVECLQQHQLSALTC